MAIERRSIVFTMTEFAEALQGFALSLGKDIPATTSGRAGLDSRQEKPATLHFAAAEDREEAVLSFSAGETAEALARFCVERHIPIPQEATKRVAPFQGNVALLLEMGKIDLHAMVVSRSVSINGILRSLLAGDGLPPIYYTWVKDGESALQLLNRGDVSIDMIFVNFDVRTIEDMEFVRTLRKNADNRHCFVPILALLFDTVRDHFGSIRQQGVSAIVPLPATRDVLLRYVKLACGYWDAP
ncbi:MAG: hypothetical protein ABT940_03995 [Alphaproteobacteria bacterium]